MFNVNKTIVKKAVKIQLSADEAQKFFLNQEYLVVGYTAIKRNEVSKTQILAGITFINLTNLRQHNKAYFITLDIPIATIKKLPIGAIAQRVVLQGNSNNSQSYCLKVVEKLDFKDYQYQLQADGNETQGQICEDTPPFVHLKNALDKALNYQTSQNLQDKQPFKFYNQDKNVWRVTEDNNQQLTFLLHPILLLNSNYGASSEIVRILISEPIWENLLKKLNYEYYNPSNPKSVLISSKLAISDCVFLYHFKNDKYTFEKVRELHSEITQNIINKKRSFLKIEPYHAQPISLSVKGIDIGDGIIWVTEVLAISEPTGEVVYFDIVTKDKTKHEKTGDNTTSVQAPKILARLMMDETVLITKEQVDNEGMAVIKSGIGILDEQKRQKIFNENITTGEDLFPVKASYVIRKNEALRFATGERVGSGGEVGFLSIINGEVALDDSINVILQEQYLYLIGKLKQVFYEVKGYTIKRGLTQEVIPMRFMYQQSHPKTVIVVVVGKGSKSYVFMDCEKTNGVGSSGLIFEWQAGWAEGDSFKDFVRMTITDLAHNKGVVSDELNERLSENKIRWAKYKHTDKGEWVKNALKNMEN